MSSVLLVDDEKHHLEDLGKRLEKKNFSIFTAKTISNAKKIIKDKKLEYAIIDLNLDSTSEFGGINIFRFIKKYKPEVKTVILTAYPFDDVKEGIKKELKKEKEPEKILKNIEADYVWKGGQANYITAIIEKLEEIKQKQ
jgi:ActR/RegA family two-component response regulator